MTLDAMVATKLRITFLTPTGPEVQDVDVLDVGSRTAAMLNERAIRLPIIKIETLVEMPDWRTRVEYVKALAVEAAAKERTRMEKAAKEQRL